MNRTEQLVQAARTATGSNRPFAKRGHPLNVLLYFGSLLICGGIHTFLDVISLELNFEIDAASQVCEEPLHNRCFYQFGARREDGQRSIFKPPAYLFEFPDLQIGNVIVKHRGAFDYSVNGQSRSWPYWPNMGEALLAGTLLIVFWLFLRGGLKARRPSVAASTRD